MIQGQSRGSPHTNKTSNSRINVNTLFPFPYEQDRACVDTQSARKQHVRHGGWSPTLKLDSVSMSSNIIGGFVEVHLMIRMLMQRLDKGKRKERSCRVMYELIG